MSNISFILIVKYMLVAVLTMIVIAVTMNPLVSVDVSYLALDGAILGILLAVLSFLLRDIVRYGKYTSLPYMQRIINYGALAILFVLCWIGIDTLLLYILLDEHIFGLFLPTLSVRVVLALLTYAFIVVFYEYNFNYLRDSEADMEVQVENVPAIDAAEVPEVAEEVQEQEILEHIAVKNGQKIDLIFINDIVSIQAEGDYVMIFTLKGKFLKEQTMKYFGDHLPKNKFVRVHRSNIVNIDFIQRIELFEKQSQMLKLQNNLQVKMSVAGYKELKKVLNL